MAQTNKPKKVVQKQSEKISGSPTAAKMLSGRRKRPGAKPTISRLSLY
jgi:hypothetical protein